jgi:hypothetical protein
MHLQLWFSVPLLALDHEARWRDTVPMAQAVSRNAPCPCGSGKKHKNCCLGKPIVEIRRRLWLPILLAVLALVAGVVTAVSKGISTGGAVAGGGGILALIVGLLWDPPPPSSKGKDPGAINFGA